MSTIWIGRARHELNVQLRHQLMKILITFLMLGYSQNNAWNITKTPCMVTIILGQSCIL